jgi:hypothetical protein
MHYLEIAREGWPYLAGLAGYQLNQRSLSKKHARLRKDVQAAVNYFTSVVTRVAPKGDTE